MSKPPLSEPHSDMQGVNRDARVGVPHRDPAKGTAGDKEEAAEASAAKPEETPPQGE